MRRHRRRTAGLVMMCLLSLSASSSALDFDITYDSSVAGDSPIRTYLPQALTDWERVFSDDVTVKLYIKEADLGAYYTATALSSYRSISYSSVTGKIIDDAEAYEAVLVGGLPDFTTFSTNALIPQGWPGDSVFSNCAVTQATALALGYSRNPSWATRDVTVTFNNQSVLWDFDPSDGITAGQVDFFSTAVHEVGHGLGFTSVVDQVDHYLNSGLTTDIYATPLDLFRTAAGEVESVGFTAAARVLLPGNTTAQTGLTYPDQVFHTGLGELAMSTGAHQGDGYQASHFENRYASPRRYLGIMDPLAAVGPLDHSYKLLSANDLMTLGLIGWNVTGWDSDADMTWIGTGTGGTGTRWGDNNNWYPYAVPSADHDVFINQTDSGWVEIDHTYTYARDLVLNSTAVTPEGIRISSGGRLSVRNLTVAETDAGVFRQFAGSNTISENLVLGKQTGSSGTYQLQGGVLDVGGTLTVGGAGNGTFEVGTAGAVTLTVGGLDVGTGSGSGTLVITNTLAAVITVNDHVTFGANAHLTAVAGSHIHMAGAHFHNESTTPANLAQLTNLELIYDGGTGLTDTFELAALDHGRHPDGFVENFTIGALTLDAAAVVQLIDSFDNGNRSGPGGSDEAIYLESLTLVTGATLDLAGFHAYVRSLDYAGGDVLNGDLISMVPGDADGDWKVDGIDLALWQIHYDPLGLNDNTFDMGDWTGDGRIDGADLATWQSHYDPLGMFNVTGAGSNPTGLLADNPEDLALFEFCCGAAGTTFEGLGCAMSVPEPGTLILLGSGLLGMLGIVARRRMH